MQYAPTNFISSNLFLFLARGPHVCRLKMIKFVGKVVLFERSELTTFPLSKFNHFQETRQSWGVLSFCLLFLCTSKEKVSRHRRNRFQLKN